MSTEVVHPDEVESYWAAVRGTDLEGAAAVAEAVYRRTSSVEAVLQGLVVESQQRVGSLWAHGEWTVADEHAATAINEVVAHRIGLHVPGPQTGPLLLVSCVEREWHALPALVVTLVMRARGWRTELLGANTSRDELVDRILDQGPRAVLLSASLASSLPRTRRQVEAVRGTGTPVVVGGRAFDAAGRRAERIGASAHATGPAEAAARLDALPHHVPPAPPLRDAAAREAADLQARTGDVVRRVMLVTFATLDLPPEEHAPDLWSGVLAGFLPHVVDGVVGALVTDDPTVVAETRSWLVEVLGARLADPRALDALWGALEHELRDYPEVTRLLASA
ncbi:cobalamin B12-binding domain-containing protein [Nocardioides coralli]|uniref:cobalamin B12-binding domain-containing protein n=1 Tax=Nocardioides coralli TaxID=2872154 RepID=UPI001CA3BD17|nr:cobalamin B12-binding domain-containing protein [Nocardioides coralli]QZY28249.1 cobalamin B12-binding domain-containing protein [Nocardioides coralli]